ncbi:protein FAM200C-like [Parasteatoda tepidariorum]|uniref:protein FAM200C-like n=1 Tax=Parasteatoda tepidariorum TaxID=114398 RepID=UPI0039BCC337
MLTNHTKVYFTDKIRDIPVSVERFHGGRRPIQCFRCQAFGHTQISCSSPPKCMKCAEGHHSFQCKKPRDTPATCCNCNKITPPISQGARPAPVEKIKDRRRPPQHHLHIDWLLDLEFFTKKKAQFLKSGTLDKLGFGIPQKPLVEASLKVAYHIAKSKKPHTIGETLIKPCALEMVELIIDELKVSPFPFSMQLDETTDISNYSQLLVFVHYVSLDTIKEEFLFCESLLQTTKAVDVLAMLNVFFTKQDFGWEEKLHSLRTDGATVMLGNKSGFAQLVKKKSPNVLVTHCFLHKHALATKLFQPA